MSQLYFSPIALTAGIFSMKDNVIPFIPASFGSFVGLVFAFGILGIVMALAGRMRWDRKIRGPHLEMLRFCREFFLIN